MTLEERKQNIIVTLQLLKSDCAWFNETEHIQLAINMLTQIPLRSDIYPDDQISQLWKQKNEQKLAAIRKKFEDET